MKIPNFGVEEWLNVWENDATYDIAGSTISSLTLEEIIQIDGTEPKDFFEKMLKTKMNYGWIEGSSAFKEEVSKLYQSIPADNILQTNGATGANLVAVMALVEPGDHVISMYPTYQQLYDIPRAIGAEVSFWNIHEENNWIPDIAELKEMIRPNTKLVALNNANNPTGTLLDKELLQEIVAVAEEVGAYILVDEVYQSLVAEWRVPSIVDLYDKGVATNSLSKTYSVPGVRVGWTASNKEVADLFRKYRDYTMICAGVLDDYLAVHILKNKEAILERNRKIVLENLRILAQWVEQEPRVSLVLPKAVSTSFIKLDIPLGVEEFCIGLLKEKGVLLVPGNRFGFEGYARLGYCADEEVLKKGLAELSDYLRQFDRKKG